MKKLLSLTLVLMLVLCSAAALADTTLPPWSDWNDGRSDYRAGQMGGFDYQEPSPAPTKVPAMAGDGHEHNWVTDSSDYSNTTVTDNGNGTHHLHWEVTYNMHCTICGNPTHTTDEYDRDESHVNDGTGVCKDCGAKITANDPVIKECKHLNYQSINSEVKTTLVEPAQAGHKIVKEIVTTDLCLDCGTKVYRTHTYEGYEVHVLDDMGQCVVCGWPKKVNVPATSTTAKPTETKKPASSSTGSKPSSGSSDMPKTGSTGMANEAWILLSACCFIALCAVRKVRAK